MPGNPLSITLPTVGDTEGPDYATLINNAITIIVDDLEAQVLPSEITVNEDFSYSSSGTAYGAVDLDRINFTGRGSLPSGTITESVFTYNSELYFQDGAGNNVAITSGGSVAGAPGNITTTGTPVFGSSGTALLWSGGDLQFQFKAGASAWADLVFGDAMFRNGTNTMTMTSGVTTDYTITWPTTAPGSGTKLIQVNSSGTLSFSSTIADATTFTNLITASAGATAAANQDFTVSGTGRYRHGLRSMALPIAAGYSPSGTFFVSSHEWNPPAAGEFHWPVPLEAGKTISSVTVYYASNVAEDKTITLWSKSTTDAAAPSAIASQYNGTDTGASTLTMSSISHTIVAGDAYSVEIDFGGTDATHRISHCVIFYTD